MIEEFIQRKSWSDKCLIMHEWIIGIIAISFSSMLKGDRLAACVKENYTRAVQANHLNKSPSSILTKMYFSWYSEIPASPLTSIPKLPILPESTNTRWNHSWCKIFKMALGNALKAWRESNKKRRITSREWMEFFASSKKIMPHTA